MTAPKLDPLTLRRLAIVGEIHEKTIAAYGAGRDVRPSSRVRIERALRELGLEHLIRPDAASVSTVPVVMASHTGRSIR